MENNPNPAPNPAPAPAPAQPAPAPAPAEGQPLFAQPAATAAPANGGAKKSKMPLIIGCSVGGVLVLAGIIVAIVFITGTKTLKCTHEYDGGSYKLTENAEIVYRFGSLSSAKLIEESWSEEPITDEMLKNAEKTDQQIKDAGYKSFKIYRKDEHTAVGEAELDITDEERAKDVTEYEEAKKYFKEIGYTCEE